MKVSRLIELLGLYEPDLEVNIVDGYAGKIYSGDFEVVSFKDLDGWVSVDIGIGGCEFHETSNDD